MDTNLEWEMSTGKNTRRKNPSLLKNKSEREEKKEINQNKEVIKMGLDIKQSEGRKQFDEEFDRHMKKVTVREDRLDWEDG